MKEFQEAFLRPVASAAVVTIPEKRTQEGDLPEVTLAKINALLNMLKDARPMSGVIYDEAGAPCAVRRALLNVAASATDTSLVAAVAGHVIRVISVYALAGGTATNLTFNSASTAISALLANDANGGEVLPRNVDGWFQTVAGEALTVTTGAGATTGLQVNYILVPNYVTDNGLVQFIDGVPQTIAA